MSEPSEKKTPFVVGWRDGFMINIPQVDREHKHLFDLVRRLELSTVSATVDELLDYVALNTALAFREGNFTSDARTALMLWIDFFLPY